MKNDAGAVARRWFEEVWNERRDAAVDELMAPDSLGYVEGQEPLRGPAEFKRMKAMFLSALPDVRIEIEDVIPAGDRAAVRWRAVGTHSGVGFGFCATPSPINLRGTRRRSGRASRGGRRFGMRMRMRVPRNGSSISPRSSSSQRKNERSVARWRFTDDSFSARTSKRWRT